MKESLQEATQRALLEGYKNLNENKSKKTEVKSDKTNEIIETVRKAITKYDVDNISVDENEGIINVMYASSSNSFPIDNKSWSSEDIDDKRLVKELDKLDVGHCFETLEESKKTEAYNYNWRDDIEEVENTEANDDLVYAFAENLMENDPDYAEYDDPWEIISNIISIWKINKRSRLYDYLIKWYGSEEEMKKHVRSFYETNDAIYFETGTGYSIFDADLLGGNADGRTADEFGRFVANGGKKEESKQRDFKAEFLALPEKEQEKYKKCIPPLRRGLSNVEAETIAKESGLDAGILWWVTNIGQLTNFKESKKVESLDDIYTIKYNDAGVSLNIPQLMKLEKEHNVEVGAKQVDEIGNWEVTVTGNKENIKAFMKDIMGINYEEISDDDFEKVTESEKVEAKEPLTNYRIISLSDGRKIMLNKKHSTQDFQKAMKDAYKKVKDTIKDNDMKNEVDIVLANVDPSFDWLELEDINESKKVEAKEDTTSAPDYLEKAFEVEVEYWLKALVDENSNDEIGKKAQEVLDDNAKMKSIVDELVNGSDDLWEDIHRRIEELAGLHYRESSRVNESNDVNNDINFEELYKDVSEFSNEISIDDIKGAYNKLVDLKNQFNLSGKINVLGNFGFGIDVDKETAKRLYDEIDWYNKKYSVIIDETDFDKGIVCIAKECADAGQFGQIALDNVTNQAGYNDFARLEVTYNEI